MLIDAWLPAFDTRTRHEIRVAAPRERVWSALLGVDLAGHPLARTLLLLRVLPVALVSRERWRRLRAEANEPLTLAAFEKHGFRVLAEAPPREVVIGLEGAFWKPGGGVRRIDASAFRAAIPPGVARAAWNFAIEPIDPARCVLTTETRIATGDVAARRRFRAYWALVRPGSSVIRRVMLRMIRDEAERPAHPAR